MILSKKTINSHIQLLALEQPPLKDLPKAPMKRLELLSKTRRFDDIKKAIEKVKGQLDLSAFSASTIDVM